MNQANAIQVKMKAQWNKHEKRYDELRKRLSKRGRKDNEDRE